MYPVSVAAPAAGAWGSSQLGEIRPSAVPWKMMAGTWPVVHTERVLIVPPDAGPTALMSEMYDPVIVVDALLSEMPRF